MPADSPYLELSNTAAPVLLSRAIRKLGQISQSARLLETPYTLPGSILRYSEIVSCFIFICITEVASFVHAYFYILVCIKEYLAALIRAY